MGVVEGEFGVGDGGEGGVEELEGAGAGEDVDPFGVVEVIVDRLWWGKGQGPGERGKRAKGPRAE